MSAVLLLEDGRTFVGSAFGATTTRVGEAVFNTAMSGYQEVLTDPSYAEQVVAMSAPHIGNTGVNSEDPESERVFVAGFVVRSLTRAPSSWRSQETLHGYLERHGVPGIEGIDTRALVRHLRDSGAQRAVISTDGTPRAELMERLMAWPGMEGRALATEVSCTSAYVFADPKQPTARIAVLDGGCKRNILRLLAQAGAYVRVHPLTARAEELLDGVDAVLVSNGPGDPAALHSVIAQLQVALQLARGQVPVLGICLGCQLLALACGAKTYKLKFGHRGANQPVRDERTGRVEITSQNHGFAIDRDSLLRAGAVVTHTHLNDGSVSGFAHPGHRIFAVQYHPEANPGPHDSRQLFTEFLAIASGNAPISVGVSR